jgi:hypothetical protein
MMVEAYRAPGGHLHLVAWIFGVSAQRVHQAVNRHAPESMRPAVRPPHWANRHLEEPRYA